MKKKTDKLNQAIKTTVLAASLAVAAPFAMANGNDKYTSDNQLRDAWLDGKIETALLVNRHLNNFTIDTEVKNSKVMLSGTVNSEIDRDLAEQIAKSIDGITTVDNDIIVKKPEEMKDNLHLSHKHQSDKSRKFGTWYDDATTTASIKSELLWNENTSGLDINVDTAFGVVTLNGVVETAEEKELIEQIAQNTAGVKTVESEIEVDSNS